LSQLSDVLASGKFVFTCELNPPKGTDLQSLISKADRLSESITAFNITDSAGSNMAMAPIGVARILAEKHIEPILQVTCRDRNRIALQAELLAASALDLSNVLCMSGDPPGGGDHPDAKAVFDIDAIGLLHAIQAMNSGKDLSGNEMKGDTNLFPGAVVNPGSPDIDKELSRMEDKIKAGAAFFQSQGIYEPHMFEKFMNGARAFGIPILAGIIVLKSANMARYLNSNLPGVYVPDDIVNELESSQDRSATSIEIAGRTISEIRSMCEGVHIMAIGWESRIPKMIEAAGLRT